MVDDGGAHFGWGVEQGHLGKTEIYQTTQPVTFEELRGRTAWPEIDKRGGHQPNPST